MKKNILKHLLLLLVLAPILYSCEVDSMPKLIVTEQYFEIQNNGTGVFYFTLKNKGDQPAFNMLLMADVMRGGKSVGYREKAFGILYADEVITDTLQFYSYGLLEPDSVHVMMTYTPYNSYN